MIDRWYQYTNNLRLPIAGGRVLDVFAFGDTRAIHWSRGEFCDSEFLARLSELIPPGSRVLDCGANVGNHSIYFGQFDFQVEAIEAHPKIYEVLQYNTRELPNIRTHNVALWSSNGIRLDFETMPNPGQTSVFPSVGGSTESLTLDCIGLESDVSLVKIDVEGAELEVIAGADVLLSQQHPLLWVEVHPPQVQPGQVIEALAKYGYQPGADLFFT